MPQIIIGINSKGEAIERESYEISLRSLRRVSSADYERLGSRPSTPLRTRSRREREIRRRDRGGYMTEGFNSGF